MTVPERPPIGGPPPPRPDLGGGERGSSPAVHTTTVLIATGATTLSLGIIIGIGVMWMFGPKPATDETAAAVASSEPSSAPAESASAAPSGSAAPKSKPNGPTAAQIRLAKLRKKIRGTRLTKLDSDCQRFLKGLPAGYVYQGGTFEENRFVAGASGCSPVATASKAPWFCCRR